MRNIPELIREFETRWKINVGSPFVQFPNYVAPALRADGAEAVIKIGARSGREIQTEWEAMRIYDGRGSAKLLEADLEQGVLLIERLLPGKPLSAIENDDDATIVLATVIKKLWRPLPPIHHFPHIQDWAKGLDQYRDRTKQCAGPIPRSSVDKAQELFDDLIASMQEPMLLHGDLHHGNVLSARREPWLAIDPKGVAAEPAYETASMLGNPPDLLKRAGLSQIIERRIKIMAEQLGFEENRILRWGIAQSVLSAVWGWEDDDHQALENGLAMAEILLLINLA